MSTKPTPDTPATQPIRYGMQEVIDLEKKEIDLQRDQRLGELKTDAPHVGLSFSGGGIRSATFNLGILQGLREAGVLPFIDYLSTVSGGGYIGTWFTTLSYRLAQKAAGGDATAKALLEDYKFLDEKNDTSNGSPYIHHLRKYSRYLAPKAGITSGDTWTMVSTWLRNTLLVQTLVISLIAVLIGIVAALPVVFRKLVVLAAIPKKSPVISFRD